MKKGTIILRSVHEQNSVQRILLHRNKYIHSRIIQYVTSLCIFELLLIILPLNFVFSFIYTDFCSQMCSIDVNITYIFKKLYVFVESRKIFPRTLRVLSVKMFLSVFGRSWSHKGNIWQPVWQLLL